MSQRRQKAYKTVRRAKMEPHDEKCLRCLAQGDVFLAAKLCIGQDEFQHRALPLLSGADALPLLHPQRRKGIV